MVDRHAVSRRIRQVMKQLQLNQQELARRLGISQPAVSQYLQGRLPPPEVLLALARLGNTTIEWLLTGGPEAATPAVAEPAPLYGRHAGVLPIWTQLPPPVQAALLALMRQILGQLNTDDAAKSR